MLTVTLADETDFAGFRTAARNLVLKGVPPPQVLWKVAGAGGDLFGTETGGGPATPIEAPATFTVPRAFLDLAGTVICHRDPGRFGLLYRLLWRLRVEPHLLKIASDPDVSAARALEKAIRRDEHKMHAFVRFREVATDAGPHFVAWFEPDHFIEERCAGFFVGRFASMRWSIVTPRRSVHWDGDAVAFGPGGRRQDMPADDAHEALWLTYFSNIFNPARLKVKAMEAEMPKKYWRNLPEARLIPGLIAGAEARTRAMMAAGPTPVPLRADRVRARITATATPDEPAGSLAATRAAALSCMRCPLHRHATRTVFGEGPEDARLMVVGEQPGDTEDLAGRPFVGPAGAVFDAAMAEAGLDRSAAYVTNAVKHFKFEPRGKRRIHKRPDAAEVEACRWWLAEEIRTVAPDLVIAMGATALQSLTGRPARITDWRGRFIEHVDGPTILATVHPSYILRLPDPALQDAERRRLAADLLAGRRWLEDRATAVDLPAQRP